MAAKREERMMEQRREDGIQSRRDEELVIDLGELFSIIWHHMLLIIESGLCLGLVFFLVCSLLIPKKYESTTKVYILNKQSDSVTVTYSDLQSGAALTKDYKELIKSLPVLEQVVAQLQLPISTDELAKHISVSSTTDTRIISISVEDEDPYLANAIANAVRIAASKQIAQVMDIEAVNIVQKASYPNGPSKPATMKLTLVGGILGAFLAMGILCILYILDDTIKNPEDVEKTLGVSVLGSIPVLKSESDFRKKGRRKRRKGSGKSRARNRGRG